MNHDLGLAILNYNGLKYLEKFLSILENRSPDYAEIYVIDNNSTDTSVSYLKNHHPNVHIIELKENYGFAGGYNEGLKHIEHEYIFLINSDIEIGEKCIENLMEFFIQHEDCAAAQPKIKAYASPESFEYAGAAGGFMDILSYPFCRGRIFDTLEEDNGQYDSNMKIFWATGAAMLIRKEIFNRIGGFDETYFAHQEEIDLCWRIKRAGYSVYAVSDAVAYHVGGGTLSYENPHKTYLNFRNNLMTILKNEPAFGLYWKFPVRLILDGISALKFLAEGKLRHILSVLRAHIYIYSHFGKILKLRKFFRQKVLETSATKKEIPIQTGKYHGMIIFDYFIKQKKKFSSLKGNISD